MHIVKDKRAAGQLKCAHGALPASVTIFNDFDVSTFIDVSLLVTVARPLKQKQCFKHEHIAIFKLILHIRGNMQT